MTLNQNSSHIGKQLQQALKSINSSLCNYCISDFCLIVQGTVCMCSQFFIKKNSWQLCKRKHREHTIVEGTVCMCSQIYLPNLFVDNFPKEEAARTCNTQLISVWAQLIGMKLFSFLVCAAFNWCQKWYNFDIFAIINFLHRFFTCFQ